MCRFADVRPVSRMVAPNAVCQAEQVVGGWVTTIEAVLGEAAGARGIYLPGLQGEIDFWTSRQATLQATTDQLKTTACQNTVSLLIAGQSKMLKTWRVIDGKITDAANETKDICKCVLCITSLTMRARQ